jgi:hypothetical protein
MCYRYFDNVRINALKTMIAFRTFPLAELIELLAFDEEMDVLNFANCLGIELDYRNPTDLNMARGKENIDVAGITPISKWVAEKKRGTLAEVGLKKFLHFILHISCPGQPFICLPNFFRYGEGGVVIQFCKKLDFWVKK